MAERLGHAFLRAAMGPVNYTASLIMARQVQSGLTELTAENLLGAVKRGIALVATRSGVPVADVERYLPVQALHRQAAGIAAAQQQAVTAWKRHAGHVGGLLEGVADLTIDGRPPDLAVCLARLARKVSADREWSKPLMALSDHAAGWTNRLYECRDLIDGGEALAQAFQRRRMRRVVLAALGAAAVGLGAVIGGWYLVRVGGARARIDDAVSSDEICSWEAISPTDRPYATDAQRSRIEQSIAECAARREKERQKRAAEERERALEKERELAAKKRAGECAALATALDKGTLTVSDEATAGGAAALMRRVGWRKLIAEDVAPPDPKLPCADTSSGRAIGDAYEQAIVTSPGAWLTADDLSDRARSVLKGHADELQLRHRSLFALHADKAARKALVSGDPAAAERAERLCGVAVDVGMRRGPNCLALGESKP